MARPLSDGLPYIGLPTNWFRLPENKILRAKLGANAVLIWTELYLSSFEINGYYKAITDDDIAILADEYRVKDNFIREVLHFLASRSLIDDKLLRSDKVITSRDIQLTFQEAVKERGKKRDIEVREGYWLLDKNETRTFIKLCPEKNKSGKNTGYSVKNGNKSGKNAGYSRRKEKREKESKVKESIGKKIASKYPKGYNGHLCFKAQSIAQRAEKIRKEYTRLCPMLPEKQKMNSKELALIRKGIRLGYKIADYTKAFKAVSESRFLKGESGKWRASFSWLISPDKMAKVLAGEYCDYDKMRRNESETISDDTGTSSFDTDDFFTASLHRSYGDLNL